MIPQSRPLIDVLAERPDVRPPRGKRHPLAAMLALACRAMRCGSRSYTAIAEWGRHYGAPLVRALGFPRRPPCAATLHTVFRRVEREVREAPRGMWAEGLLTGRGSPAGTADAVAIDGNTLRGRQKPGAPGAPRLAACAPRLGRTLAQQAVADTTKEIPVVLELRRHVVLEGRVVTMEAVLTPRQIAHHLLDAGGHSVMVVKNTQPQLLEAMQTVVTLPPIAGAQRTAAETRALGHGRIEPRPRQTSPVLVGYSTWPGLAQVLQGERQILIQKPGAVRAEVVAGGTSLPRERADAGRLLALVRGHWHIEHQSHGGRDVPCDEERSQVRGGNIPPVMAAFRNTVIGRLRWAGHTNLAAACRRCAAQPTLALELIGIALEN
jgi:hypothetical protein